MGYVGLAVREITIVIFWRPARKAIRRHQKFKKNTFERDGYTFINLNFEPITIFK